MAWTRQEEEVGWVATTLAAAVVSFWEGAAAAAGCPSDAAS